MRQICGNVSPKADMVTSTLSGMNSAAKHNAATFNGGWPRTRGAGVWGRPGPANRGGCGRTTGVQTLNSQLKVTAMASSAILVSETVRVVIVFRHSPKFFGF